MMRIVIQHGLAWRRGTLTEFIDRNKLTWEVVMGVLTAAYIGLSFFEDSSDLSLTPFTGALFGLSVVFLLEFASRCWDAPSRHRYLAGHWVDLVTSFPLVGPFRALRLLRLLRMLRLGLAIRRFVLGSSRVNNSWLIWPLLLFFWWSAAYGLWLAEHSVNRAIATFNDALFYAFLTACTVGYGSFTPMTTEGKVIAGAIVFVAIGLVGFTSARLTAMYLGQKDSQVPAQLDVIERELAQIRRAVTLLLPSDATGLDLTSDEKRVAPLAKA